MTEEAIKRGPGRPPKDRAEETRRERRRKPGAVANPGVKLTVDESMLDRNRYEYRFVRDTGNRVRQLHDNDWDIATEGAVQDSDGAGTVGSKIGGTDEHGKPYDMVLMRKERDWYKADQREKASVLNEMDKAIRAGRDSKEVALRDGTYVPGTGNKVEQSGYRP